MRRRLLLLTLFLAAAMPPARAQVVLSGDLLRASEGVLTVRALDGPGGAPLVYASAYLVPKGDTLITNFTLTDTAGTASLTRVARGTYTLHVELLGYKDHISEIYFSGEDRDMGPVFMPEDRQHLDAARVTAIGRPMEVFGDTVVFHASSYMIGSNAMLSDLLRRMPGIAVEGGTVSYNGQPVSRITVGGRTFFFGDPSLALQNLPAKVVDKVRVIEKDSGEAARSGVDDARETVMDLELHEEYRSGWFGNARAAGGATLARRQGGLVDDRGLLYSGGALVSAYGDRDQVTGVATLYNAPMSGGGDIALDDGGGLRTLLQGGVNYNTQRLAGLETSLSADAKRTVTDDHSITNTEYFFDAGGYASRSDEREVIDERGARLRAQLRTPDDDGRIYFSFMPSLWWSDYRQLWHEDVANDVLGVPLSSSYSDYYGRARSLGHAADMGFGIGEVADGVRSIEGGVSWELSRVEDIGKERSEVLAATDPLSLMNTLSAARALSREFSGNIGYTIPLAEKVLLSVKLSGTYAGHEEEVTSYDRADAVAAFTPDLADRGMYSARNPYMSSYASRRYLRFRGGVLLQWRREAMSLQAGFDAQGTLSESRTETMDKVTEAGVGEWLYDGSPYVHWRLRGDGREVAVRLSGQAVRPTNAQMRATLDVGSPTALAVGNAFLRPGYRQSGTVEWRGSDAVRRGYWSVRGSGTLHTRPVVYATARTVEGVQVAIPVNAKAPAATATAMGTFGWRLTKDGRLGATADLTLQYGAGTSYQKDGVLAEAPNIRTFNYNAFMADIFGTAEERFYSGASGYRESRTRKAVIVPQAALAWRGARLDASLAVGVAYAASRYSFDAAADADTWDCHATADATWCFGGGWEVAADATAYWYAGYPAGTYEPYFMLCGGVTKAFGALSVVLRMNDILGQGRGYRRIVAENYVRDAMDNVLGRHFFICLRWNFGRLNADMASRANDAALYMAWD